MSESRPAQGSIAFARVHPIAHLATRYDGHVASVSHRMSAAATARRMSPLAFSSIWDDGYIGSPEARQGDARLGRGCSWIRTRCPLIDGETDPPVAGFLKLIETANGLVVREHPGSVFFANVDPSVHFLRQPEAGRVSFDTRVSFGPTDADHHMNVK